jgi:hypothetical protein
LRGEETENRGVNLCVTQKRAAVLNRAVSLVILMLLLVAFLISVVFCDSYPQPQRREWKIEALNEELRLLSKSLNFSVQDEFELRFRLVKSPQWILSSWFRYAVLQDVNYSQMDFTFDLFYLVEFVPNATYPMYVGEGSEVVSVWPPNKPIRWDAEWNTTQVEGTLCIHSLCSVSRPVGGVLKRSWTRTTEDGVLTLRVHVDQLVANGTQVLGSFYFSFVLNSSCRLNFCQTQ